jgi:hypothetical protein
MKRGWLRWTIRIGAGIAAAAALLACVVVFLFGPQNAVLLVAVLLQPLLSNTQPPSIFADAGPDRGDFNAFLKKKFPAGIDAEALKATLLSQGFKRPRPPPVACWPRGKPAPVGQVIFPCPVHDPNKTLEYEWGRFPCGDTLVVWWSSGDRDELTDVGGYHSHGCL